MGGRSFSCACFGFVSVIWRCGCLASRVASREVPLLVFMREFVLCPVFNPIASAVAERLGTAQDFVDALRSVAKVAVFSPDPWFSASFWEFCS